MTQPVIEHVVKQSVRRQTGARGLSAFLTRHLEEAAFEAFAHQPGGEVRLEMSGGEIAVKIG